MTDFGVPLIQSEPVLRVLTVFLVLVTERFWPWSDKYHPLVLFRLMAQNLAKKVHPKKARSAKQQMVSGFLAAIMLIAPPLLLIGLILQFAEYPEFFHGLILLMCVTYSPLRLDAQKINRALKDGKKALARDTLSRWVLRETRILSPMGIAKATCETLLLRAHHQYMAVVFWFMVLGIYGALAYRLLFALTQAWNRKNPRFIHFGVPVSNLFFIAAYIPARLMALTFAISGNAQQMLASIREYRLRWKPEASVWILASAAGILGLKLGGPCMYWGEKRSRIYLGEGEDPDLKSIPLTLKLIHHSMVFTLLLMTLFAVVIVGTLELVG